ncbi:hypothetical protein C8J57DRAFT_1253424 [Mycena rebaudengoi]|nr:hypothetical protein C8J57DRAFT_1253424 [Mycena rebaudengoi]
MYNQMDPEILVQIGNGDTFETLLTLFLRDHSQQMNARLGRFLIITGVKLALTGKPEKPESVTCVMTYHHLNTSRAPSFRMQTQTSRWPSCAYGTRSRPPTLSGLDPQLADETVSPPSTWPIASPRVAPQDETISQVKFGGRLRIARFLLAIRYRCLPTSEGTHRVKATFWKKEFDWVDAKDFTKTKTAPQDTYHTMPEILEWVHITIHRGRNFQLFFRR